MRDPLIAGILSLLVPGLGQIYNGQVLWGILWLILTGLLQVVSIPIPAVGSLLALLAIAAGVLILLGR